MASLLLAEVLFLSNLELVKYINSAENYVLNHGIDESVINAFIEASKMAILTDKDIEYGKQISYRSKSLINAFTQKKTDGMDIWALERYQQDNNTDPYKLIQDYYDILKLESRHVFESFMLHMVKHRPYKERF